MPSSQRIARLVFIPMAIALSACGPWRSNTVDLDATEAAPVQIVDVSMRHSLMLGLGSAPADLGSGDAPNAIGVDYQALVNGEVPPHAGITAGLICKLGEHAVRSTFAHDANRSLEATALGERTQGSAGLFPSAFQAEIPRVCEAAFSYSVSPPLAPRVPGESEPAEPPRINLGLGRACVVDKELRSGPCSDAELPRVPADAALEVTEFTAQIGPLSAGGYGLRYQVMVTTGLDVPQQWTVGAQARCEAGGTPQSVSFMSAIHERRVPAGESVTGSATSSAKSGMATQPERCTLTMRSRVGETMSVLAEYCVSADAVESGACDGLPSEA